MKKKKWSTSETKYSIFYSTNRVLKH